MTDTFDYNSIVRRWYEDLKPLFINYLHKHFNMNYDDILDIYTETWLDVRRNILNGNVAPATRWKSYILKIGWNKACNSYSYSDSKVSIDDDIFDRNKFEAEYTALRSEDESIYRDPAINSVLASELEYTPEPCNKILKLYYYEELSMNEIATAMNYSGARTAITTKQRCLEKLKFRVLRIVNLLGLN